LDANPVERSEKMKGKMDIMKEIKLLKLSLRDFQGGTITFDAKGKDVFVFGANAVGKTRLVSAFTWLLFDKDALGRSDFEIKNLDAQGEAAHGLEHSVEAELTINGEIKILKKVFKEKWTKKRGNANREFSGHTTEYFIDGVPAQEKDYNVRIADMTGDESNFRLVTSPTTFPALHWQKQRTLLLEVCGDISDADVIASSDKLSCLLAILGKHSLDDHRKIVTTRRSEINKEMEKIPVRIDEVRRGLPDVTGIDRKKAEKDAQGLETALNDAKLRLQGINTGGNIADLTKKLSGLNADLRKMEDGHRTESLSTLNRLNQEISEAEAVVNALKRRIGTLNADHLNSQLRRIEQQLSALRERWILIDGETFQDTIQDICPSCGQGLPSDRVQEARDKAISAFNQSKAQRLTEINSGGMDLKSQRERIESEIFSIKKEREGVDKELPEAERKLQTLTTDRDVLKQSSEDFSGIPNRAELLDEIEEVEDQIKAEREGKAQDIEKIKEEIKTLEQEYFGVRMIVDRFRTREQGEKRIEELKAEEKKLAAEFEKLEGELYLTDLFVKTKVGLLTDRINSKFETVRFKLFNSLINGGIEDCCEITVNGVPFNGGLNSSARTQAGCDIIRTLQQHFKMKAPVFCDNRESVTDLPKMDCQLISLVVSPEDKTLRIERR
jgi:cytochrome c556